MLPTGPHLTRELFGSAQRWYSPTKRVFEATVGGSILPNSEIGCLHVGCYGQDHPMSDQESRKTKALGGNTCLLLCRCLLELVDWFGFASVVRS